MADNNGSRNNVFVYMGGDQRVPRNVRYVRIHKSVKIIARAAFRHCSNLVSIEMHDGVEIIEDQAFWCCSSLRKIKLAGVRAIGHLVFLECKELEDVECADKLETIGNNSFQCTSLTKIKLPKVRSIGIEAFGNCKKLMEVKLSEDLERIEGRAFCNSRRLKRITMPLKDNLLGNDVFYECPHLLRVDIVWGTHKTISSLLLESWRNEIYEEIERINRDLPNSGRYEYEKTVAIQLRVERVIGRIEHYKSEHRALLKELTTLLELALWKAKLDESQDERSLGSDQPAKKVKIDMKAVRQEQRITSGASAVIKNVLHFLKLE